MAAGAWSGAGAAWRAAAGLGAAGLTAAGLSGGASLGARAERAAESGPAPAASGDGEGGAGGKGQPWKGSAAGAAEAAFETWLRERGAKGLEQVAVGHVSEEGGGAAIGRGLFLREGVRGSIRDGVRWRPWRPALRVSFPLSNALTPASCIREPRVGWVYRALLEDGTLSPRLAVMAFLIVERLRGATSPWAPYIAMLPEEEGLGTPLFFSDAELQMLRGTTLHAAVTARQKKLRQDFRRVKSAVAQALQACKHDGGRAPAFSDFLWASGIYWSRVLELPLPERAPVLEGGMLGGGVISQVSAPPEPAATAAMEGLCPGLDCCNHGEGAPGRWRAVGQVPARTAAPATGETWLGIPRKWLPALLAPATGGQEGSRRPDGPAGFLELISDRALSPGEEVRIDYGARSNEELLFTYGFVDPHNPHDTLLLSAPLTAGDLENPVNQARMELLHARGLRPQAFLPLAGVSTHGDGGHQPATAKEFPPEVIAMMEVMVLPQKKLAEALELARAEAEVQGAGAGAGADAGNPAVKSGKGDAQEPSFAALTLLVRLMQLQVYNLEGPGGTGSLEHDTATMLKHLMAEKDGEGASEYAGSPLSRNAYHALLYRMNQKRIARAYTALAERLLSYHLPEKSEGQKAGAYRPYRP